MASPKRDDFKTQEDFIHRFEEVLRRSGTSSQEAQEYSALANTMPAWWPAAEESFRRRLAFEKLMSENLGGSASSASLVRSAPNPLMGALLGGILSRLRSLVISSRLQGILIGLIATIMGVFGYQQVEPNKPEGPSPPNAVKSGGLVAIEAQLKAMSGRIDAELKPEAIAGALSKSLSESAKVQTIAPEAIRQVVEAAKSDTIRADAVKGIVEAIKPAEIQAIVKAQVATSLGSPEFAKSVSDQLKAQVETLAIPKAVEKQLTESPDFAKKIAEAVKAAAPPGGTTP